MSDTTNAPDQPEASAPAPAPEVPATPIEIAPEALAAEVTPVADAAPIAEEAAPVAEEAAPVAEAPPLTAEQIAEQARLKEEERVRKEEERAKKDEERRRRDETFTELQAINEAKGTFAIAVHERVKGGLRGEYKGLRVFLPASHFGMRKNVSEDELNAAIGQTFTVQVHELQSDDTGHKSAVVTRRDIMMDELWSTLQPGAEFDGVVTSVTPFGAFVNIGGIEGLVHVSRLSRSRVENPSDVVKKGDRLKVTLVDVDRAKKKLSLSHKEHEADAWVNVETDFPVGKRIKGTVRRIADFGAYVQVAPKIEGLLRISELSWTQRVKHPSDVVSIGQEIDVEVLGTSASKHQLSLGFKQTLENPWTSLATTLPVGSEAQGVVQNVSTQGAVVRVNDAYDGFMPRSKMLGGRNKPAEVNVGDSISCVVVDMDPAKASLILAQKGEDGSVGGQGGFERGQRPERERGDRGDRGDRPQRRDPHYDMPKGRDATDSNVTLADMINDAQRKKLQS